MIYILSYFFHPWFHLEELSLYVILQRLIPPELIGLVHLEPGLIATRIYRHISFRLHPRTTSLHDLTVNWTDTTRPFFWEYFLHGEYRSFLHHSLVFTSFVDVRHY